MPILIVVYACFWNSSLELELVDGKKEERKHFPGKINFLEKIFKFGSLPLLLASSDDCLHAKPLDPILNIPQTTLSICTEKSHPQTTLGV